MATTPHTAGRPAQPRQGIGARIARRLGSAVRQAIAGGVAIAGGLRRPARPNPALRPSVPKDPATPPRPRQPSVRRPASTAQPSPPDRPARSGWLGRWFRPIPRQQPAPVRPPRSRRRHDAPFTPETHPGLSPQLCKFLNTPLEECDPEIARLLFSALARYIATVMPPGAVALGLTNAEDLFAYMWGRLDGVLGDAALEPAPATQPDLPPTARQDTAPDGQADIAPVASPATPSRAAPAADHVALPAPPAAPCPMPEGLIAALMETFPAGFGATGPSPEAPAAAVNHGAAAAIVASASTPDVASMAKRTRGRGRSSRHHGPSRRHPVRPQRHGWRHALPHSNVAINQLLPPRRRCYAARAGPP